jgi:hypothetical protein
MHWGYDFFALSAGFTTEDREAEEIDGEVYLTVELNPGAEVRPVADDDITIAYSLSGEATEGEDYTLSGAAQTGYITILQGDSDATVTVNIEDDEDEEADEGITITLNPTAVLVLEGPASRPTTTPAVTIELKDNDPGRQLKFLQVLAENVSPPYRAINTGLEALNVSNELLKWYSDPDNFRISVWDTAIKPNINKIQATLEVISNGTSVRGPYTYDLVRNNQTPGFISQEYLRLVSDSADDKTSSHDQSTDPNDAKNDSILVKLGDSVKMTYGTGENAPTKYIKVGRDPTSEASERNNDDAKVSQLKHDIRVLDVMFVVLKGANGNSVVSRNQVQADIDVVNERLAQSTIRVDATIDMGGNGDPGIDGGATVPGGVFPGVVAIIPAPLDYLRTLRIAPSRKDVPIVVFYVETILPIKRRKPLTGELEDVPLPGFSITAQVFNELKKKTGMLNFAVVAKTHNVFTVAHELMHILLNRGHIGQSESNLGLFSASNEVYVTNNFPAGRKRIGPFHEVENKLVYEDQTNVMRDSVLHLPGT